MKWNPVSTQPEHPGVYLVFMRKEHHASWATAVFTDIGTWSFLDFSEYVWETENITHWMRVEPPTP